MPTAAYLDSYSNLLRYAATSSAGVDSLIDAHLDAHRNGTHTPPSQSQMVAGVGYFGTRPEHTRDYHSALAVLAGTKPAATVSGDFFGASDVGRRVAARLLASGHYVQATGNTVSIAKRPVRYSRADGVAHPLVRGFRIEHALRHLTTDPTASANTQQLAHSALYGEEGNPDNHDAVLGAVHALGDSLQEDGHPLADEYSWAKASHALHLDAATGHLIHAVAEHYHDRDHAEAIAPARGLVHLIHTRGADAARSLPEYADHPDAVEAAAEGLDVLKEHYGDHPDDIHDSLDRHSQRHWDMESEAYPEDRKRLVEQSLKPSAVRTPQDFVGSHVLKATRYSKTPSGAADFVSALRRVHSRNQDALRTVAKELQKKLKLQPATTKDVVHDRPGASTANVAQSVSHDGDRDRIRLLAAWTALQTQTPSMLVFHAGDGDDVVYRISATGSGERLRSQLDRHGLTQRVMVPHSDGYHVIIYSPQSQHEKHVTAFANTVGGRLSVVKGEGEVIGGGDEAVGDSKSRRTFRSIISAHERKKQQEQQQNAGVQPTQPAGNSSRGPFAPTGTATATPTTAA